MHVQLTENRFLPQRVYFVNQEAGPCHFSEITVP